MVETSAVMYGIPNCDTIKKARNWLQQQGIDYQFHDYKKHGVDSDQLQAWIDELGWETLINKRGTTWRKLDDATKNNMDATAALQVMLDNPSIIKRPLLIVGDRKLLGFDENQYRELFNA